MFSWRGSSHRDLSMEVLRVSFRRDSSPIALSPFLFGIETVSDGGTTPSHGWSMIDSCPSSFSLMFRGAVLLLSFAPALWFLRHLLRLLTITLISYPRNISFCVMYRRRTLAIDFLCALSQSTAIRNLSRPGHRHSITDSLHIIVREAPRDGIVMHQSFATG